MDATERKTNLSNSSESFGFSSESLGFSLGKTLFMIHMSDSSAPKQTLGK